MISSITVVNSIILFLQLYEASDLIILSLGVCMVILIKHCYYLCKKGSILAVELATVILYGFLKEIAVRIIKLLVELVLDLLGN